MFIAVFLLRYITTWITMTTLIIILLAVSEVAYGFFLTRFTGRKSAGIVNPAIAIAAFAASPILLPDRASKRVILVMPILALSALFPVCSSISFFTFSPLIDNGGDILQILHFITLSQAFALFAVYALGTEYSSRCAARLTNDFIKLLAVLMAIFATFAIYFTALGIQANPFSLDVYSLSLHLKSLTLPGRLAIAVFVFLALSYSSHCEERKHGDIFCEIPLSEFNGFPRAMLQTWAVFKVFLTVTLITHVFFPWFMFKETDNTVRSSGTHLLAFVLFWLTVILARVFGVTLSRNIRLYLERKLPATVMLLLLLLLIGTAMGVIYYQAYLISLEAY